MIYILIQYIVHSFAELFGVHDGCKSRLQRRCQAFLERTQPGGAITGGMPIQHIGGGNSQKGKPAHAAASRKELGHLFRLQVPRITATTRTTAYGYARAVALMFMLDADTCIFIMNDRLEALRTRLENRADNICISAITHAELCFGVEHSSRIESNKAELEAFCLDLDIAPYDLRAGTHYGEIRQLLTSEGSLIGANDLLIASHARSLNATLVTNNVKEFK